jgi:phosphatidylglycerol:prolipoprotein diacylglycerol transferase
VPRYDLGLLEMLFAVIVAAAFALTWKRRLPVGWYAATLAIVYAPVRFGLDFLRVDDPDGGDLRYAGLTPAQWACVALFGTGVFLYARLWRAPVFAR